MVRKGFLVSSIQQKQKKLEFWRKGYLKALEELKNAKKILQEVIDQSETVLSEPSKSVKEINQKLNLDNKEVQKGINNNIPIPPSQPKQNLQQSHQNIPPPPSGNSRMDFNKEIQDKIKEGVKPSDLKKQSQNINMSDTSNKKINLDKVNIKKMRDATNTKDYFVIVDDSNPLDGFEDNYKPIIYNCVEETMETGWDELVNNYGSITAVEIEYKEDKLGKRVISLIAK